MKNICPHPVPKNTSDVYDNLGWWAKKFSACPAKIVWVENKKIALVLLPRNNVLRDAALRVIKAFSVKCYGVPGPDRVQLFQCMNVPKIPVVVYAEWELTDE